MRFPSALPLLAASSFALILAACSSTPTTAPTGSKQQFQQALTPEISLNYQIERKASNVNGKACYAFITGTVHNRSAETLSRQSVLDFIVIHNGKQLFRDLSNPVSDIPPGSHVAFSMVDSPVHKDGCPSYDRIDVNLRKVVVR